MRFLADESCDSIIIKTLREAGHDVLAVGEINPRAEDSEVLALARKEKRILLTKQPISFSPCCKIRSATSLAIS